MKPQRYGGQMGSLTSGMISPADVIVRRRRSSVGKIGEALVGDSTPQSPVAWRVICTFSSTTPSMGIEAPIQGDNATEAGRPATDDDGAYCLVLGACRRAAEEFFEDGVESQFAIELKRLIRQHEKSPIEAIAHLVLYAKVNPETGNEALATLGTITHPGTHRYRRWLLERALGCPSAVIRDGAVIGLAWLDDPHAIPYVERAAEVEQVAPLRTSMEQLLEQLRKE